MAFTTHPVLFFAGLALVVAGFLLRRIVGRWDLKGHAVESAVRSLWRRRVIVSNGLQERYRDVRDAPSHAKRVGRVAGHAARHFAAQALSIGALVTFVIGIAMAVLAVVWQ